MTTLHPRLLEVVSALRSGAYNQGKYFLHFRDSRGDNYCTLGIFCHVADRRGVPVSKTEDGVIKGGDLEELHEAVIEYFGFRHCAKDVPYENRHGTKLSHAGASSVLLAGLNDAYMDFNQMADFIEANADKLFDLPPVEETDDRRGTDTEADLERRRRPVPAALVD